MPTKYTGASSSCTSISPRKLPDDLFYVIARDFLPGLQEVSRLSRTCHRLAKLLKGLLYRRNVLDVMIAQENATRTRPAWEVYINPTFEGIEDFELQEKRASIHESQCSVLHWAASRGFVEVAKDAIAIALKLFPDYLNAKDSTGLTPLSRAVEGGHVEIIQELINAGCLIDVPIADIFLPGSDLWIYLYSWSAVTPLTLAIAIDEEPAATLLAQHVVYRADIYKRDPDLNKGIYPPLHIAATARMCGVVRNLLSNGHDPGDIVYHPPPNLSLESTALTALHYAAASEDNTESIDVLLSYGASLNTHIRSEFRRPLQLAIYGECPRNALHLIGHHLASGDNSRWPQSGLRRTAGNDMMLEVTEALVKVLHARGDFEGIKAAFLIACKGLSRSFKTKRFLARFLASELNQAYLGEGQV
ncbi:ankyrin repeat-containing domain protein [Daldinia bambusicola]|nr:ankyrin repeat-containing domain protein [Daldinia bambusicola]